MSIIQINILKSILSQIVADCQQRYPDEACGLLIGDDTGVREIVVCQNTWPDEADKNHRFTIDPLVILKTEKAAADRSLKILGTYHSHPDHPAVPSQFDLEVAWPVYFYLILEIQNGINADIKAWHLDQKIQQFSAVQIVITY